MTIPELLHRQWRLTFQSLIVLACLASGEVARAQVSPIKAWGQTTNGKTTVPDSATNVVAIATGGYHGLALRNDGTIVGWGDHPYNETTPPANATNVVAVAAGDRFSLALRADGTVVGWGLNTYGQVTVPPTATNLIGIAAGGYHSVGMRRNGTLIVWGRDTIYPPAETNCVAIAAGIDSSVILRADGTVREWEQAFPWSDYPPPPEATNVIAISMRYQHVVALRADRSVVSWGVDQAGETIVPASATNIIGVAAGDFHSLALRQDGSVMWWGNDAYGKASASSNVVDGVMLSGGSQFSAALQKEPSSPVLPRVGRQPENRTFTAGHTLSLNVLALGSLPLRYQWYFGNTALSGQTNHWLAIPNGQPDATGSYSVIVTNNYGSVTSAVATITVTNIPRPLLSALRATNGASVSFYGFKTVQYAIEYKDRLQDSDWQQLDQRTGAGGTIIVTDPAAPGTGRFYRVRIL
jgi:alpha-tubulin suppressor-like RCC1 family protein